MPICDSVVATTPGTARGAEAVSLPHRQGTGILTGKRYTLSIACDGSGQKSLLG